MIACDRYFQKIPAEYCKNSMTMFLMTQNTTKIINTIFTPKYGEYTIIALFYSISAPLFWLVFIWKISVLWYLNYLIIFHVTDHKNSIIFKAYKHFMSKPEIDKLSVFWKILFNPLSRIAPQCALLIFVLV